MKRVRWGRERRMQKHFALEHEKDLCPDCRTDWKSLHDPACEVEECPYCGHALMGCGHAKRFWKGWRPKLESGKKGLFQRLFG